MSGLWAEARSVSYGVQGAISKAALAVCLTTSVAVAEPVTVLAFGDSLTQGYGLPVDQGFVPQMQAWLTEQGRDVTLINAGVSGDTTAGGLARVDWSLTPDVDAMIVALGGNDMLRGIDPAVSRANLTGILQAAGEVDVLLVGLMAPGNYGPEFKAAFDPIYPDLSADFETGYFANFFQGIIDQGGNVTAYMQPDGIHPTASGVSVIVEAMGPAVLELLDRVE